MRPEAVDADGCFSDAYLRLREKYLKLKKSGSFSGNGWVRDAPSLKEKTFRVLWYEGRYERRGLRTTDGRRVSVLSPGEWNLDEGPDFRGAEIRLEDQVVRGDVELHLRDRDWRTHGHHKDPLYESVVLHVFLQASRSSFTIRTASGQNVGSVSLSGRLPEPWSALVRNFDAAGYPYESACGLGDCGRKMTVSRYEGVERLLFLAGDGRILLKAGDFPADDAERFFYTRLSESLGYHRNKHPMRELSRRVPWNFMKDAVKRTSGSDRVELLEALFLGAGGLLPASADEVDPDLRSYWKKLSSIWKSREDAVNGSVESPSVSSKDLSFGETFGWMFRGIRPNNHPVRRLAGLARWLSAFFQSWEEGVSFESALFRFGLPEGENVWMGFLQPAEGRLSQRAGWTGKKFPRPTALIGQARAQAIWVNVFLPSALRWCRLDSDEALEKRLHDAYVRLRLMEPNGPARLMAHRLLGAERARHFRLAHEHQQQGLLQIFQDFCDTKPWACRVCVFPKILDLSMAELNRGG